MSRISTIDLNRSFQEIAGDLQQRAGQELRAKKVNGTMVLYSKKVGTVGKLIGNLFHGRPRKLEQARQLVATRFEPFPAAFQAAHIAHVRSSKPTADNYLQDFKVAGASAAVSALRFRDLNGPSNSLVSFLEWGSRARFLPGLRALAKKQSMDGELKFVEAVDALKGMSRKDAAKAATRLCLDLFENSFNVAPVRLQNLSDALGVSDLGRRSLTEKKVLDLKKSPEELWQMLSECRSELVIDLSHAVFLPYLKTAIGDIA